MKLKGFTLAEILITLSIIGVVAAVTLPALMTNISERSFITGLKKGVNTLNEICQRNKAKNGFGFSGLNSGDTTQIYDSMGNVNKSLYAVLLANSAGAKYLPSGQLKTYSDLSDKGVLFSDGQVVTWSTFFEGSDKSPAKYNIVMLDVNGSKGPNRYSNCDGDVNYTSGFSVTSYAMGVDIYLGEPRNLDQCKDNKKRVIRDRFKLYLDDNGAIPLDAATQWAMDQ